MLEGTCCPARSVTALAQMHGAFLDGMLGGHVAKCASRSVLSGASEAARDNQAIRQHPVLATGLVVLAGMDSHWCRFQGIMDAGV
eukprot:1161969-Pelagomonas_calceolata.AAC.6